MTQYGVLTLTVTNRVITGTGEENGSATLSGTVSESGAITMTTDTIADCPGVTVTFTGQISGSVMTGTWSNPGGWACAVESGTWSAAKTPEGIGSKEFPVDTIARARGRCL